MHLSNFLPRPAARRRRKGRRARPRSLRRTARFENLEHRVLLSAGPAADPFAVNTKWDRDQQNPAVGMAYNGDFVVAWDGPDRVVYFGGGGIRDTHDVYFRRYAADATAKDSQQVTVANPQDLRQHSPDVAMDPNGNFVVVWTETDLGWDSDVLFQRFNAAGAPHGLPARVNTNETFDQADARVAMAGNGDFVVVWEHSYGDNFRDVYYRRFYANGAPIDTTQRIAANSSRHEVQPDVATDDWGRFAIVWTEAEAGDEDVYYQLYASDGSVAVSRTRANTTDNGIKQRRPAVAVDQQGYFTIAWQHRQWSGNEDVYAQMYSPAGSKLGPEIVVDNGSGNEHAPDVAMTTSQFVVAYQDDLNVFFRRYSRNAQATPRGGRQQILQAVLHIWNTKNDPAVAMNPRGEFVVAMECDPSSGTDYILAQKLRHDRQTAGLYDPATAGFYLKYSNTSGGGANQVFTFGPAGNRGWTPLVGDWDFDGDETVGLYDPSGGVFHLKNSNTQGGGADVVFRYGPRGNKGWIPVVGDWNGDGIDTAGLYDPLAGAFHLKNANVQAGGADVAFRYGPKGNPGWTPLVGDWNGDGIDTVGLYCPTAAAFHLKNSNTQGGGADVSLTFGPKKAGWQPLAGDWNRDGIDSVGLRDPKVSGFHLKNSNTQGGGADVAFRFGPGIPAWIPLVGDWQQTVSLLSLASGGALPDADAAPLGRAELSPIIAEAFARWQAAGVQADFSTVEFVITDLPGATLGMAERETIYIDRDAAGHGWFVDPTPESDEEFRPPGPEGELVAVDPDAVDQMDLLTVVSHELGHLLGLEDLDPFAESLMSGTLETGLRRGPGAAEREALFADDMLLGSTFI